jgi:serine/threonine-protein kinase RsbW
MKGCIIVRLEVPGVIQYRDIMLRTLSATCKLITPASRARSSRASLFSAHLVSAAGEAYNNIALHGYAGREPGTIRMEIEQGPDWIRVVFEDTGASFDPALARPPDLDALPESGLGVFIMQSFVDEVTYVPGPPNVLTLFKRLDESPEPSLNSRRRGPAQRV